MTMQEQQEKTKASVRLALMLGGAVFAWYVLAMFVVWR